MKLTAKFIADYLGGSVEGDENIEIKEFARIEQGKEGSVSFLANPKYEKYLYESKASIIIINKHFRLKTQSKATLIWVDDAYSGITRLLTLYANQQIITRCGRERPSHVSWKAKIGKKCYIGKYAYIAKGAKIGNNVKIFPHVYIGENTTIGDNTILYSGVKIYHGCTIGANCIIHCNSVIGADGFGFAPDENRIYQKIPQIGNVIIHDDVEIGSNTCVDRATMGSTVIGKGSKLDNLIQIAHNVEIGTNSVFAAQVGIAGSSKVGNNVMFAGQAGIINHLKVGNNVKVGAQTGIMTNIEENLSVFGTPAIPSNQSLRLFTQYKRFPDLIKKIKDLEEKIAQLSK